MTIRETVVGGSEIDIPVGVGLQAARAGEAVLIPISVEGQTTWLLGTVGVLGGLGARGSQRDVHTARVEHLDFGEVQVVEVWLEDDEGRDEDGADVNDRRDAGLA